MADLVAPIVPTGLNAVETALKGFALVAGINQRNREIQLSIEQMAQQERLRQQQFKIDQKKIAQDQPLIAAQTDSYKALADLHKQQAKAYSDGVGNAAQRKAREQQDASAFGKELDALGAETPIGTRAWNSQAPLIKGKYTWSPDIEKIWNAHLQDHYRATTANRLNQKAIIDSYAATIRQTGLDAGYFQDPYKWADVPGTKGAQKYILLDENNHSIDPKDDFFKNPANYPKVRAQKMDKLHWDMAMQAHQKIQDMNLRQLMAPDNSELPQMMPNSPTPQPSSGVNKVFTFSEDGELTPVNQ